MLSAADLPSELKASIGEQLGKVLPGGSTNPKATDPYRRHQQAHAAAQQKKDQVVKAARLHAEAQELVEERRKALENAVTENLLADQAAEAALADYNSSLGLEVGRAGDKAEVASTLLGVDTKLFDDAEDYEDDFAKELLQTKTDLENLVGIITNKTKELEDKKVDVQRKKEHATKKRKAGDGSAKPAGQQETPAAQADTAAKEKDKQREIKEKADFEQAFKDRMAKEQEEAAANLVKKKAQKQQHADPTPAEAARMAVAGGTRGRPPLAGGHRV